jgi:hypothetical protein
MDTTEFIRMAQGLARDIVNGLPELEEHAEQIRRYPEFTEQLQEAYANLDNAFGHLEELRGGLEALPDDDEPEPPFQVVGPAVYDEATDTLDPLLDEDSSEYGRPETGSWAVRPGMGWSYA